MLLQPRVRNTAHPEGTQVPGAAQPASCAPGTTGCSCCGAFQAAAPALQNNAGEDEGEPRRGMKGTI